MLGPLWRWSGNPAGAFRCDDKSRRMELHQVFPMTASMRLRLAPRYWAVSNLAAKGRLKALERTPLGQSFTIDPLTLQSWCAVLDFLGR